MNAIKLPVSAHLWSRENWTIQDANGVVLCGSMDKPEALQIVTALNMHDELVEALKFYANRPDGHGGNIAKRLLHKIESANENKPTNP